MVSVVMTSMPLRKSVVMDAMPVRTNSITLFFTYPFANTSRMASATSCGSDAGARGTFKYIATTPRVRHVVDYPRNNCFISSPPPSPIAIVPRAP